jgi:glycosyltransferase involved in cell wall biosynthesis
LVDPHGAVELLGFVDDIAPLFASSALFICPIRSGSGVRVKLLEAFASGIPVVSTYLGAEGLARKDGEFCALADDPVTFADKVVELLDHPDRANAMALRARREVEQNWDMAAITTRLVEEYRRILQTKRAQTTQTKPPASATEEVNVVPRTLAQPHS